MQARRMNSRRSKLESNGFHAHLADTSLHQRRQGVIHEYGLYVDYTSDMRLSVVRAFITWYWYLMSISEILYELKFDSARKEAVCICSFPCFLGVFFVFLGGGVGPRPAGIYTYRHACFKRPVASASLCAPKVADPFGAILSNRCEQEENTLPF